MKANKIKKLKQKIKTWKVWFSKSMFGFDDINDIYFARAVVLPNHGLHLKACSWNLNVFKNINWIN